MSGGGGSGNVGPTGPSEDIACAFLRFDTTLASPNPEIPTLAEGDVLSLSIQAATGGRNMIAALANGRVAGAITDRTADLLRCMQEGFEYEAEVTEIDGGWVRLTVRPA